MKDMLRPEPEALILAVDIGSSSTRSALFDLKGDLLAGTDARREYAVQYTPDGGAELSPLVLRRAARVCLRETLRAHRSSRLCKIPIVGVGGSAFWHSLLGLDGKDRPLTPVFTWADSRCAADAAQLREEFDERKIHAQTGCMLRASFWPAKLRWLRRTNRQLFRRVARWVSPADWIFEEIFDASGSSHSMASATGLYDARTQNWHTALAEACEVDLKKPGALVEVSLRSATSPRGMPDATVFSAIGDGAAGNLGCGADRAGRIAINVGTSAAVRMMESARGRSAPFGLSRYAVDRERMVVGGAVSNAGNLRRWCSRELRIEREPEKALHRKSAADDALTVLPFWVGERAPTWPENLRGTIVGLTQSTDAAQIFRATTCAVYYRLAEILDRIETRSGRGKEIIVSGGILRSRASLELLADALGRDICISSQPEASLRGAAVYVLEKLGYDPAVPKAKLVRHDHRLAQKHRLRRERQAVLEKLLSVTSARGF
jgi:gluconokinase